MGKNKFQIRILGPREKIPSPQEVSAVFLIALADNNIVAIRNHRGWDLPAGHIEEGEGILGALKREVREEASMGFTNSIPFVIVTTDGEDQKYKGKCMIGFATKQFVLSDFIPAPDSQERKVIPTEEFLSLYEQDKIGMRLMIEKARSILDETDEGNFHTYHCTSNKLELAQSKTAGCFYCKKIFTPKDIKDWVSDKRGETAICPYCMIDSVYGDASGRAVNEENLKSLNSLWF